MAFEDSLRVARTLYQRCQTTEGAQLDVHRLAAGLLIPLVGLRRPPIFRPAGTDFDLV